MSAKHVMLRSCFSAVSKVHWAVASLVRRQTHVILPGDTLPPGAAAVEFPIQPQLAAEVAAQTWQWLRSHLWSTCACSNHRAVYQLEIFCSYFA